MPLAAAVACGLVAALFYLSVLTGSFGSLILVYLVQLPLFGAGLSLGTASAAIAGGTAALATAAAGGLASGSLFLFSEALPVALLVHQTMRRRPTGTLADGAGKDAGAGSWSSAGLLTVSLVTLGGVVLIGAALALSSRSEGFQGSVQGFLAGQLGQLFINAGLSVQEGSQRGIAAAGIVAPLFPALAVGSWLLMTTINGVLAQGALARFALNRRPAPDMASLTLPRWLVAPLAAAGLLAVLGPGDLGYLGRNLLPVLAVAYVFAGLAVVHAVARRYTAPFFILVPAYALLLLGWPILLLAACGMIDQWFGLRSRFAAASRQGEE